MPPTATAVRATLAGLLLLVLPASGALAAPPRRPVAPRLEPYLKLSGLFFGNFFQAPNGSPEEDIDGFSIQLGASRRVHERRPLKVYGRAEFISYRGFNNGAAFVAGVREEAKRRSFDVAAQLFRGRPSREAGDVLSQADGGGVDASYGYRVVPDVELSALGDWRHESYEGSPRRENDTYNLGLAVRYRGFGYKFSPEVGFRRGGRSVVDDNEDLSQREAFVRLRFVPARAAYVAVRYRRRWRDYSVELPTASNFGREDTRDQWTVAADYKLNRALSVGLYFAHESTDSTRPVGAFDTRLLQLSASWSF